MSDDIFKSFFKFYLILQAFILNCWCFSIIMRWSFYIKIHLLRDMKQLLKVWNKRFLRLLLGFALTYHTEIQSYKISSLDRFVYLLSCVVHRRIYIEMQSIWTLKVETATELSFINKRGSWRMLERIQLRETSAAIIGRINTFTREHQISIKSLCSGFKWPFLLFIMRVAMYENHTTEKNNSSNLNDKTAFF